MIRLGDASKPDGDNADYGGDRYDHAHDDGDYIYTIDKIGYNRKAFRCKNRLSSPSFTV